MKKYILPALAIAAMMVSCNNQSPKMDEQPAAASADGLKIAYVEVDSLITQYNFAKDQTLVLQKKASNAESTINKNGNALQAAMNNFQQKQNNNAFESRQQAESQYAAIQRQQQSFQELQVRLNNELENEKIKFQQALGDSLKNFLEVYNKDKKYDLILTKPGVILIANKSFDITQDVINGMNKRYKPSAKPAADEKKADEKKADEKKADEKK